MKYGYVLGLALFALSACGRDAAVQGPGPAGDGASDPEAVALPVTGAFTVQVALSDAARARLAALPAETVIVSAAYFADAAPEAEDQADEVGQIDLGSVQAEIPGEGEAVFDGSAFQRDRLALTRGTPQVNINVFSGRRSSQDNLLDCGMFQDAIEKAAERPIGIDCRLIGEAQDRTP